MVWIQLHLRDEARRSAREAQPLSVRYWRWFAAWMVLGTIAFLAFVLIFWLMVGKRLPFSG